MLYARVVAWIRRVRTASGATAVQIAAYVRGRSQPSCDPEHKRGAEQCPTVIRSGLSRPPRAGLARTRPRHRHGAVPDAARRGDERRRQPEQPLTEAGRAAVQRVAGRARTAGVRIGHCVHSGKRRAEQTAHLLVSEIGAGERAGASGPRAERPGGADCALATWGERTPGPRAGRRPALPRQARVIASRRRRGCAGSPFPDGWVWSSWNRSRTGTGSRSPGPFR